MTVYGWAARYASQVLRVVGALWLIFGVLDERAQQRHREDVAEAIRELGERDDVDEDGGSDE